MPAAMRDATKKYRGGNVPGGPGRRAAFAEHLFIPAGFCCLN